MNIGRNENHYTFQDGTSVNTISGTDIVELCEISAENEINTTNEVWLNDGYSVIEYENGTKTYYKFDSDGVCVNKFTLSADSTLRALTFEGTRNDDNQSYRFSSLSGVESKLADGMGEIGFAPRTALRSERAMNSSEKQERRPICSRMCLHII